MLSNISEIGRHASLCKITFRFKVPTMYVFCVWKFVVLQIYWSTVSLQPNAKKFKRVKFVSSYLTWGPTSLRPILPLLEHCWILHNWCKSTVIKTPLSCCLLCGDSSRSLYVLNVEILLCRHHPLKLWKTELTHTHTQCWSSHRKAYVCKGFDQGPGAPGRSLRSVCLYCIPMLGFCSL